MIDIHSHIIFDVDDGAVNLDESLKMITEAKNAGIKTIITTPHFMDHVLSPDKTLKNLDILIEKSKDIGIDIKLGYEVILHPLLLKGIDIVEKHTLNKTKYILVEFPFSSSVEQSFTVLSKIQLMKLKPVIAHPERIDAFIKKKQMINNLKDRGCLLQVNAGSIVGYYGERSKIFAKQIIKDRLADFVASDAHKPEYYSQRYIGAFQKVTKWTDEEYAQKLFYLNAQKLL